METTGVWIKTTGAKAVNVGIYEALDARRRETLNYEIPSHNTNIPRLIDQLQLRMPQHHRYDMMYQVAPRKRPSTDIALPAGGKRLFARKDYLDQIFHNITPEKADKIASKHLVDKTLKEIMHRVVRKEGGRMYSRQYIDAGSYPVKMKICKADEFDVNIPLNIDPKRVRLDGNVKYYFDNRHRTRSVRTPFRGPHLNAKKELFYDPDGTIIPPGYAVVEVETESLLSPLQLISGGYNLSSKFLHRNLQMPLQMTFNTFTRQPSMFYHPTLNSNRSATLQGCIELIPLDVKKDLLDRIIVAINVFRHRIPDVRVSSESHGPALKMTIRTGRASVIKHDISVDITASLQCDIPVSTFGWPREETKRAFSMEHINEVLKAGTHLVTKKDLFWAISFSKAERILLASLDRDQGCRKYVAKILKKFVMTCSSQSPNGLPGISSHIIKTQVLWSCEEHGYYPNYWHWDNRDDCVISTMVELENTLSSRRQPDYFNPDLNILEGKDTAVLNKLVRFIQEKRNELYLMI